MTNKRLAKVSRLYSEAYPNLQKTYVDSLDNRRSNCPESTLFKRGYLCLPQEDRDELESLLAIVVDTSKKVRNGSLRFKVTGTGKEPDTYSHQEERKCVYISDNLQGKTSLFLPTYDKVTSIIGTPESDGRDDIFDCPWSVSGYFLKHPRSNRVVDSFYKEDYRKVVLYYPESYLNEGTISIVIPDGIDPIKLLKEFKSRFTHHSIDYSRSPIKREICDLIERGQSLLREEYREKRDVERISELRDMKGKNF